jgi:hypothetical protein
VTEIGAVAVRRRIRWNNFGWILADLSGYEQPEPDRVATWLERGYGAVTERDRARDV